MTSIYATAQPAMEDYELATGKIISYYNQTNYDSIWCMLSGDFQKQLPVEKAKAFFTGVRSHFGKIDAKEYIHQKSTVYTYKLNCEQGPLTLNLSLDDDRHINGLTITPFKEESRPSMARNTSKLILPFKGEWTVFWGGDTKELNYHVDMKAQKNAFDMVMVDAQGKTYKTDGKSNEDYYAFGQPILAPCDAEVIEAVDGVKENTPGEQNPIYAPGNSVMLKTKNNEYILLAHFKNHSIKVHEEEQLKQGQLIGLCGNTGNSSEPHLHFHIENVENMNIATGVKCYFDKIVVNGSSKSDYSPIKGDKVKNED